MLFLHNMGPLIIDAFKDITVVNDRSSPVEHVHTYVPALQLLCTLLFFLFTVGTNTNILCSLSE